MGETWFSGRFTVCLAIVSLLCDVVNAAAAAVKTLTRTVIAKLGLTRRDALLTIVADIYTTACRNDLRVYSTDC